MRLVENIEAEIRALDEATKRRQHELQSELCAALLHRQEMTKQAKHLEVRTIYPMITREPMFACASPKGDDGSFWVGVGPENKLLVAYEYIRAHRYCARSGRVMGKPIPSAAYEQMMLDALDREYARLSPKKVDRYNEMMTEHVRDMDKNYPGAKP